MGTYGVTDRVNVIASSLAATTKARHGLRQRH